jgi:hypothetical protein
MDAYIYLYDVTKNFKFTKKIRLPAVVTHLDFSDDSTLLHVNTQGLVALIYDIRTGKQAPRQTADVKWATWTCPLGKNVAGVFRQRGFRGSVLSLDRCCDHMTLATGDTQGLVKLFKYPCPVEGIQKISRRRVELHAAPWT